MAETNVFYNASCPICSREIAAYEAHAREKDLPIRFTDLAEADLARWGLDRDAAARRMYVVHDGRLHSGIDGFLVLWREMPRFRWLARVVDRPVLKPLADAVYDRIAAPLLYRMHRARERRQQAA